MFLMNFFVLAFVLFMAYWWGNQGFFSAVLHTAAVIIAGSLAFATWELWTYGIFMKINPANAWGVGLLIPFVVYLQIFRLGYDKLIKTNVHFSTLINMITGGILGFISAILTAGILVIGLGFLSLGPALLGHQPYLLGPDGHLAQKAGGGLWIPVDTTAANFFSKLSTGTFSNATPLKYHFPELVQQSSAFRIHVDGNATYVAKPGSVVIDGYFTAETPFSAGHDSLTKAIGNDVRKGDHRVVVLSTKWTFSKPPYNGVDGTLRVSPSQVQLITKDKSDPDALPKLYQPIGASKQTEGESRTFIHFKDAQSMLAGTNPQGDSIAFLFVVPMNATPVDLIVRRLRMQVPEFEDETFVTDVQEISTVLGQLDASQIVESEDTTPEGHVGDRAGIVAGAMASEIKLSNELPDKFSKNAYTGPLTVGKNNLIMTINAEGRLSRERISESNAVHAFYVPSHKAMVRIKLDRDKAQSLLGRTMASAAMVSSNISLVDDKGSRWFPTGFAHLKKGVIRVQKDPDKPIQVAKHLPIANLRKGEELYVYFEVNRDRQIIRFELGKALQDVRLTIPK